MHLLKLAIVLVQYRMHDVAAAINSNRYLYLKMYTYI